ncbi:TonB-dependent receptor plug domain-containing protein [Methylomusa anaerophila]|nr:TonB-dependent receptor [Methylomusa anaerophila]
MHTPRKSSKTPWLRKQIALSLAMGALIVTVPDCVYAEDETVFQLDQVEVTANRIEQKVAQSPNDVTVVTGEQIQLKNATTVAEALNGVSGIIVESNGGSGGRTIPYILGSDRIVVLIDGKRVNLPQGVAGSNGGVDLSTMMLPGNVDRIEVVRGGGSALYGADAVGGVINIITKKSSGATQGTATVAAGNYGGRLYELSVGGQENKTHWFIGGHQDLNDGQRGNAHYEGKSANIRLDQDLRDGEALSFTYDYYSSYSGVPGSLQYLSLTDYQDILRHNWSMAYTRQHADGIRTLRYYDNEQVYSGDIGGDFRDQNKVRAFEYQDSARLNRDNLLTWGSEWRKDEVTSTGEGNTPHSGITRAVFIQDQISIGDHATWTVGLRHDDNSLYGTHWLPKLSFLYQGNAQTSYFANWGKVFRAPRFDDLYGNDGWGNTGNPNLRPETGWTAEVGVKSKLNAANEATLSVFKRTLKDAIRWQPEDPSDPWSSYHPQNIDQLTTTGFNLSLTSRLSEAITSDIGYTYLDSKDQSGAWIGDPHNSFHLGFNLRYAHFRQNITASYMDETGTGASKVGGYFTVNTSLNYDLDPQSSLFLTVNNLFDKKYEAYKNYPANRRTFLLGMKKRL